MLKKLLNTVISPNHEERRANLYRNLIRHEAKIGGELFGPIPEGGRREFFCLDQHTWIWHEEWMDKQGQRRVKTTRYDVRPNGILKAQNGQHYQKLTQNEIHNLQDAVNAYYQRVKSEIYNFA